MNRRSETVAARLLLARSALAGGDRSMAMDHLAAIDDLTLAGAAVPIREHARQLKMEIGGLSAASSSNGSRG
jgi:hypothetical protein